jgi:hypothetical protein
MKFFSILVDNHGNMIHLIQHMRKLQLSNVEYQDDNYGKKFDSSDNVDELLEWLEFH